MKTTNKNEFVPISRSLAMELTEIVNETIDENINQKKTFTSADLWNIQRQKKNLQRRQIFN
jgi:hypothetical protein